MFSKRNFQSYVIQKKHVLYTKSPAATTDMVVWERRQIVSKELVSLGIQKLAKKFARGALLRHHLHLKLYNCV